MEQPEARRGRPTIRDVARHAGVSHTTVSRVINGGPLVKAATRELVQAAISSLNFAPNPTARALAGAEHVRVVLLHRFPNPSRLGEYLISLLDQTTDRHASLLVRQVSGRTADGELVRDLVADGVEGVILAPPLADDHHLLGLLEAHKLAIVATGSSRAENGLASVGIDDHGAARAVTQHLLALGHRRIGFIKGDPSHASTEFRLAGFRNAMEKAGVETDDGLIVEGRYTYKSGLDAAERLLALKEPPTAVFASNDDMAAATVAVAHRLGIDVPTDLSVCGFDDTALATTIWPELTTVRQPTTEITKSALDQVFAQLAAKNGGTPTEKRRVVLPYKLVRRDSDAPPRLSADPPQVDQA